MSSRRITLGVLAVLLVAALAVAGPVLAGNGPGGPGGGTGGGGTGGGGTGGGEGETTVGNNLSFPTIAVDGFAITPLGASSFTVPYSGAYPGLTAEQLAVVTDGRPWYPQKTAGNAWQADFAVQAAVDVTYVDWGDNIEAVNPKQGRPFRLEVLLFHRLPLDALGAQTTMTAYRMAALEYPSSSNELQGTDTTTYESTFATVVSRSPQLVVQYLGATVPTGMTWLGGQWSAGAVVPVTFAPELNVGGKYVFGASQGGWRPDKLGYYRITFYAPAGSGVNLASAQVGNYADFSAPAIAVAAEGDDHGGEDGGVATPVVVPEHNLTFVDVQVMAGGGSGGGGRTH